jgi:hypothetical protein
MRVREGIYPSSQKSSAPKEYTAREFATAAFTGFALGVVIGVLVMFAVALQQLNEFEKRQVNRLTCGELFKKCEICADMMDEASKRSP